MTLKLAGCECSGRDCLLSVDNFRTASPKFVVVVVVELVIVIVVVIVVVVLAIG